MKILLVEDDTSISRFIAKGLKEKGYVVDVSHDGEEGLHLILNQSYDLVILDILLPGLNGYDILKAMRDRKASTPVICLTAKGEQEDIVQGLELGADDYLVKPFSFAELHARIVAVLRRGQKEKDITRFAIGDLKLDLINRTVSRDEKNIELSAKEFLLLEYLMRNAGQILTRTMILEQVWGYNFDTSSNIIDVHINHLRRKVDDDFPVKLIHTVKGVGYVLKSE
jgi:heavy metal response regulator